MTEKLISLAPIVRLTGKEETVLFLIQEELKIIRLYRALAGAGFNDPSFRPCLDELILKETGFTRYSDDLFDFYLELIHLHSRGAETDSASFVQQAMRVYIGLKVELERRELEEG